MTVVMLTHKINFEDKIPLLLDTLIEHTIYDRLTGNDFPTIKYCRTYLLLHN